MTDVDDDETWNAISTTARGGVSRLAHDFYISYHTIPINPTGHGISNDGTFWFGSFKLKFQAKQRCKTHSYPLYNRCSFLFFIFLLPVNITLPIKCWYNNITVLRKPFRFHKEVVLRLLNNWDVVHSYSYDSNNCVSSIGQQHNAMWHSVLVYNTNDDPKSYSKSHQMSLHVMCNVQFVVPGHVYTYQCVAVAGLTKCSVFHRKSASVLSRT